MVNAVLKLSLTAVNCSDPGTPTNGQHNLSSTTYTSVVNYICDVGYAIQGSNSRTCQSNGQWSGSVPRCICKLAAFLHCIYVLFNFIVIILLYTLSILCSFVH